MIKTARTTAVKLILLIWLAMKIMAGLVTALTLGEVDLTFVNPSIEMAFQALVYRGDLAVFITVIALTLFGAALGFFVGSASRRWNIVGFFAYALLILTNIVSVFVLGLSEGLFILSLVLELLILICLLCYGKWCLLTEKTARSTDGDHAEKGSENNP